MIAGVSGGKLRGGRERGREDFDEKLVDEGGMEECGSGWWRECEVERRESAME